MRGYLKRRKLLPREEEQFCGKGNQGNVESRTAVVMDSVQRSVQGRPDGVGPVGSLDRCRKRRQSWREWELEVLGRRFGRGVAVRKGDERKDDGSDMAALLRSFVPEAFCWIGLR